MKTYLCVAIGEWRKSKRRKMKSWHGGWREKPG